MLYIKFPKSVRRLGLVLFSALLVVAGCATSQPRPNPGNVGLNFWIKRTTFDLSSVQFIESQNRELARDTFTAHRRMMLENFPAMDKYIFDFSKLNTEILWREGDTAQVRIYGPAVLLNPDGSFKEKTSVDDTFFMVYENDEWKVQFAPRWRSGTEVIPLSNQS